MVKVQCPKCGKPVDVPEGREVYYCKECGYRLTISYTLEKIEGDPVSYLLKRAGKEV